MRVVVNARDTYTAADSKNYKIIILYIKEEDIDLSSIDLFLELHKIVESTM